MTSTSDIAAGIFNISDEDYFIIKDPDLRSRESWLLDQNYLGIAIGTPRYLFTEQHDHLPLILAARFSGERDWEVNLRHNCLLIGTNMIDGSVRLAHLLRSEKELTSQYGSEMDEKGPRPPDSELEGNAAQLLMVDIRNLLNIPWSYGKWVFGVISYDWLSNLAPLKLEGDIETDEIPPISFDPDTFANASANLSQENELEMPEHGVTFLVRCGNNKGNTHLIADVALSISARRYNLPSAQSLPDINAVIPVTLLLLQPDKEPLRFSWVVPAYGQPLNKGETATGRFSIDVQAATSSPVPAPGNYVCYITIGGHIFGPQHLTINK